MDNNTATKPYSPLKGDPYRAFEELPVEVRRALQESLVDWCSLRAREWHLHLLHRDRLRPAKAATVLVRTIRKMDHAEVAAFARTWPKGANTYPHVAASATIQRYVGKDGIPDAQPPIAALAVATKAPSGPRAMPRAEIGIPRQRASGKKKSAARRGKR